MGQTNSVVPTKELALFEAFLKGAQTQLTGNESLAIDGISYTGPALATKIQSEMQPIVDEDTARQALKSAEAAKTEAKPSYVAFAKALKASVIGFVGDATSPELALWGIVPKKKPVPLTPAQLVVRKAKAAATRKARGTKGKVQKAAISGGPVPPQVVDPSGTQTDLTTTTPTAGGTSSATSTTVSAGNATPPAQGSTSASTLAPAAATPS